MAITKNIEIDKIEIVSPYNILQIRVATVLVEDGEELTRTYHRYVKVPGNDVSEEPASIQGLANLLWTQQIIDDYEASIVV